MGYKSRGLRPNNINLNKCQRRFQGARANGPPSPISNNMRILIDQYHQYVTRRQMLDILNGAFGGKLKMGQLYQYCKKHGIQFSRKSNNIIVDMPNFKSSGDTLDDHLAAMEDPLDAADMLPESIKKEYDILYGE